MNKIKKMILIASFIFVFNACSTNENDKTEVETNIETNQETKKETETEQETEVETKVETENEVETDVETETETEAEAETDAETNEHKLNSKDEKYLNKVITDINEFPHGTAGSSLKIDILVSEIVNEDEFFNEKFDNIIKFTKENIKLITDKENANETLKILLLKIEEYNKNPEKIKNTLESSTKNTIKLDADVSKIQEFIKILKSEIK